MLAGKVLADVCQDAADLVRLDGQDDHLRELHHGRIRGGSLGTDVLGKGGAGRIAGIAGHHLFCGDEPRPDKAFGQCRGHLAGTKKSDGKLRRHGGFVAPQPEERK